MVLQGCLGFKQGVGWAVSISNIGVMPVIESGVKLWNLYLGLKQLFRKGERTELVSSLQLGVRMEECVI